MGPDWLVSVECRNSRVMLGTFAKKVVIHAVTILDAQDEGDARVIEEILAYVGRVDDSVDSVFV